jgi:hypothetical protein
MASKKITIENPVSEGVRQPILTSLLQDWGGVNNTNAPVTPYSELGCDDVVPIGKEWGVNRGEVERFLKSQFTALDTAKVGSACWSPTPNSLNHYELWGFKDAASQNTYLTEYNSLEPDEELPQSIAALRLFSAELPIAATAADTYAVRLTTNRTSSNASPIVVKRGASFEVALKVTAWHYPSNGGDGDPARYAVTPVIIIERFNGTTWDTMGTATLTDIASSASDDTYPNVIDIGQWADTGSDGAVQLGFRIASYTYENTSGELATMSSNRVSVFLQTVTLGIELPSSQWLTPKAPIGAGNTISVDFTLLGNVAKTLHVNFLKVDGSTGYSSTQENVTQTGTMTYNIVDAAGNQGVTTSGVHTLEAWLTYGSGADAIESEHIVHQILVRQSATEDPTGMVVLIQKMAQTVDNFVQSEICHFAVWKPKLVDGRYANDTTQPVSVRFVIADGPSLSDPSHVEYVTLPVSVTPGVDTTLTATMEVETEVVQEAYNARLHALSTGGTALIALPPRFVIDNTSGFQPTAGSVFLLNPKTRNNGETTPQTVINARTGIEVSSVWEGFKMDSTDGYITDQNGEKVLFVPAGRKLTITGYNPLRYLYDEPSSAKGLTMSFDLMTSNIVNEDDAIVRLCEYVGSDNNGEHYLGLRMRPMVGTMGSVSDNNEATTDFRWAEDRRAQITVTITPNVSPNVNGDGLYHSGMMESSFNPNGTINLVRIYINGVIVREMEYNASRLSQSGKGVEFFTGDTTANPGIIIGQEGTNGRVSGADIYIYGMRTWERGLTPAEVLQNYVSSLPSSNTKRRVKAQNDILRDDNSGRISLPKACAIGKNCLIWHGDKEPMFKSDKATGWLEIRRYGYDGTYLPQYSGSFCKTTKKLKGKGQGTTAMTYCYWNIQWKYGDVGYNDDGQMTPGTCIVLTPSQISSIIHLGTPVLLSSISQADQEIFALVDTETYAYVCPVYGGNLGKDEPVGTGTKYYPCTVDENGDVATIMLPDGWVNGTGDLYDPLTNPTGGVYCGPCWQVGDGLPYSSKHVLKINYASSMQSHLIGVNWLYNDLHRAYAGANSLQRDVPTACVTKQVVPVLFFTAGVNDTSANVTDGTANFRGLGGYGPGKMDKPTWGYSKKASKITDTSSANYRPDGHDYFAMFEGAINNTVLSDMLAPFDDTDHLDAQGNIIQRAKVKYFLHDPVSSENKDPESFFYRVTSDEVNAQTGERDDLWQKGVGFDGGKTGRTAVENPTTDAERFNNLLCNSNSCDVPSEAPSTKITKILRDAWNYVYLHNPNIRFFNGTTEQLAAATMTDMERKRKYITKDSWLLKRWDYCEHQWVNAGLWNTQGNLTGNGTERDGVPAYEIINIFKAIGEPQNIRDDRQAVVNAYIAHIVAEARPTNADETNGIGQYFKARSLRFHYAFQNYFIAGTDNCSKNTYYVIDPVTHLFELHQDDVDTTLATDNYGFQTKPYYVDRMNPYDDNDTVRRDDLSCYDGMANTLFDLTEAMWCKNSDTMANALGGILGSMAALTGGIGSPESSDMVGVWRALNRYLFDIQRYFPQSAYNETARIRYEFPAMLGFIGRNGEAPSLQQSMGDQLEAEIQFMRRRLVYMASYAGYGDFAPTEGTSAGTTGLSDAGAQMVFGGDSPDQAFTLVTHQYLFPVFVNGQNMRRTLHRSKPGEAWKYNPGFIDTMNTIALKGLNYYRSVGNVGDKTVNATSFTISGSRLTEFIAEPTTPGVGFSLGNSPTIGNATRLRTLSLKGCTTTGSTSQIPFDLSRLSMVETVDLRDTAMQKVTFPQTSTLTTLFLPATMTQLSLTAQPSLATLSLEGYAALSQLTIKGCPLLSSATRGIIEQMITAGAAATVIDINNIDWQAQTISTAMLRWLLDVGDNGTCRLAGRITMAAATATPSGRLYYNDVARLISRYGNIYDNTIAVGGTGLYVNFATTAVTESQMAIAGKKYINPAELEDKVISSGTVTGGYYDGLSLVISGAGNDVAAVQKTDGTWTPDVKWSIETTGMSSYVTIDDVYSPRMHVLLISQVTLTIRATLTDISGNERTTEKTIGLWRRVPQVGDYAWTDGEFDNEDDPSKVLAGMVVMRQMYTSENVLTTFPAQAAWYKLWVLSYCGGTNASALNVTMIASSDGKSSQIGGTSTQCWGLYPDNSGNNGLPDTKQNGVYTNALLAKIAADTGQSDIFDVPNLPNITDNITLRKNAAAVTTASGGVAMQDESRQYTEGEEVTGWAAVSQPSLNNFDSEGENSTLLGYADTVLQSVLDYFGIADSDLPADCKDSEGHTHPMTPRALSDLTQMVVMYCIRDLLCTAFSESVTYSVGDHVIYNGGRYTCINAITTAGAWNAAQWEGFEIGDIDFSNADAASVASVSGKFRELMFPAARLCNVWCPADVQANAIAETDVDIQYRRGKWMLPSSALLARIFNFYGNSRAAYNTLSAAIASNADENALEAMLPLFSNAIARGRANGIPMSYSSNYWSSTEGNRLYARSVSFNSGNANNIYKSNGLVVRPVAAFTFVP